MCIRRCANICAAILTVLITGYFQAFGGEIDGAFRPLVNRLIANGQDSTRVVQLFQADRVRFRDELVSMNMILRESADLYQGFLEKQQLEDGFEFLQSWGGDIDSVLTGSGIPATVAVAILKVESNLGRRPGRYPVIATLATLSSINEPRYWSHIADTCTTLNYSQLQSRARKRAEWAFNELVSFLAVCDDQGWDPLQVNGSWAGAFGWAQFMPSSYLRWAQDGNGDRKVDPNCLHDAVASIACYLKEARWAESLKSRRRALHLYNPSEAYVDCILEYARGLDSMASDRGHSAP